MINNRLSIDYVHPYWVVLEEVFKAALKHNFYFTFVFTIRLNSTIGSEQKYCLIKLYPQTKFVRVAPSLYLRWLCH